ncbi:hypothetical protein [Clostridium sp. CCUG 7971]|uniref:hypothetical protein n=1 Tax=Clostridium sp. CCUG 7971 TaxID=2811414 RepID=UPI001ABB03DD|nr:hypothetical protein [Clostridium sp. CCUG 7971]MBO3445047.1 hypothetical protein [Clostridium sp. CCUG 7971]
MDNIKYKKYRKILNILEIILLFIGIVVRGFLIYNLSIWYIGSIKVDSILLYYFIATIFLEFIFWLRTSKNEENKEDKKTYNNIQGFFVVIIFNLLFDYIFDHYNVWASILIFIFILLSIKYENIINKYLNKISNNEVTNAILIIIIFAGFFAGFFKDSLYPKNTVYKVYNKDKYEKYFKELTSIQSIYFNVKKGMTIDEIKKLTPLIFEQDSEIKYLYTIKDTDESLQIEIDEENNKLYRIGYESKDLKIIRFIYNDDNKENLIIYKISKLGEGISYEEFDITPYNLEQQMYLLLDYK